MGHDSKLYAGIDVGSLTAKAVVINGSKEIISSSLLLPSRIA